MHLQSDGFSHLCLCQCQNQPSPPVPSHLSPQAQCPPALALLPPHPPVLVQLGVLPKFLLVVGTMQSSGLLWPTDSPPPHPLEVRPPSSSDTCLARFHQDFAASRTTKCYWRGASHRCPPCCWVEVRGALEGLKEAAAGGPPHLFPHREQITPMQTQLEAQVG